MNQPSLQADRRADRSELQGATARPPGVLHTCKCPFPRDPTLPVVIIVLRRQVLVYDTVLIVAEPRYHSTDGIFLVVYLANTIQAHAHI